MTTLFTRTDKSLIATLPVYAFDGKIVVVQSEGEAIRAVEYLKTFKILGIDTETRPSFKRGVQHKVALLQVAGDGICFLFRLNFMGFPQCLVDLMEDPTVLKIGLSLHDDFRMLSHRHEGFHPAGYVDLQHLASGMGIEDLSLQKLWANFFHQKISKKAQLSNWEADVLDEKQRVYAATDADTCIHLYRLMSELHQSGDYTLLPIPEEPKPVPNITESKANVDLGLNSQEEPKEQTLSEARPKAAKKAKNSETSTVKASASAKKASASAIKISATTKKASTSVKKKATATKKTATINNK